MTELGEQLTTRDLIGRAEKILAERELILGQVLERITRDEAQLNFLRHSAGHAEEALQAAKHTLKQVESELATAVELQRLHRGSASEAAMKRNVQALKERLEAAKAALLHAENEAADRKAAVTREQGELTARVQESQAEATSLQTEQDAMTRNRDDLVARLGVEEFEDFQARLRAAVEAEQQAKAAVMSNQRARQTLVSEAKQALSPWPKLRDQLVEGWRGDDDTPTHRVFRAALKYLEELMDYGAEVPQTISGQSVLRALELTEREHALLLGHPIDVLASQPPQVVREERKQVFNQKWGTMTDMLEAYDPRRDRYQA